MLKDAVSKKIDGQIGGKVLQIVRGVAVKKQQGAADADIDKYIRDMSEQVVFYSDVLLAVVKQQACPTAPRSFSVLTPDDKKALRSALADCEAALAQKRLDSDTSTSTLDLYNGITKFIAESDWAMQRVAIVLSLRR